MVAPKLPLKDSGDGQWKKPRSVLRPKPREDSSVLALFLNFFFPQEVPREVSFPKACVGIMLVLAGVTVLNFVEEEIIGEKVLHDDVLRKAVVITNPNVVLPENEGKLVLVSGMLVIDEPLTCPEYGIAASVVYLKQRVQMYQWVEENGDGSDEKYSYTPMWKDKLIDSDKFASPKNHENPREFIIQSSIAESDKVRIGAYFLSREVKKKFTNFIPITSDERPENKDIKLHSGIYYHTDDVWNPQVGDIRVQFSYSGQGNEKYTVAGKQVKDEIHPYQTGVGSILHLREGIQSIDEILAAKNQNTYEILAKRLSTFVLIFLGMFLLSQMMYRVEPPPQHFQQWIFAFSRIRLCVSLSVLLFLTATGWLWISYRPYFGLFMFSIGFIPFFYSMLYFIQ